MFYVFIINEIFFYFVGIDYLYRGGDRTELVYSIGSIPEFLTPEINNVTSNLTEGYFPDKIKVSPEQAEKNRFDEFIRLLDIKPGDSILDAGCGHGGLVMYLRSKGFDAYGITITKTQYNENIENHGPYFFYGDYTEFHPELQNKFDHIILPGSLEHPFDGNCQMESSYQNKYEGMKKMFNFMKKYFKDKSEQKKILSTCIHQNLKYKNSFALYCLSRECGGLYPPIDRLSVADSLQAVGYDVLLNKDYSWHYYFTTVCDPNHFGNPMALGLPFYLFTFWFYPITLYSKYAVECGSWMYMWDGKNHYPDNHQYSFIDNINERPCTLFYTVAKLNK